MKLFVKYGTKMTFFSKLKQWGFFRDQKKGRNCFQKEKWTIACKLVFCGTKYDVMASLSDTKK